MGKGNETCYKQQEEPGCLPCMSADYLFMGDSQEDGTIPILTMKDNVGKSIFADIVPEKGAIDFTIDQIVDNIDLLGYTDIIFKTDNEAVVNFVYSSDLFKNVRKAYLDETN